MTDDTSKPVNLGTLIQQLQEYVGRDLIGRLLETSSSIRMLQSNPIIDTTLTALCARNLVMEATMVVRLQLFLNKPNSRSRSSKTSSRNTSKRSRRTYVGRSM